MSDINLWEVIVAKFDNHDKKLDEIKEEQAKTNTILAVQEVNLREHMARTRLLEERIIPVEKHVTIFNGVLKAVGAITTLGAGILGIIKVIEHFIKH